MVTRYPKTAAQNGPENVKKSAAGHAGVGHDENCRCQEASKMTPQELLKLMMSDLAFWKKKKKE